MASLKLFRNLQYVLFIITYYSLPHKRIVRKRVPSGALVTTNNRLLKQSSCMYNTSICMIYTQNHLSLLVYMHLYCIWSVDVRTLYRTGVTLLMTPVKHGNDWDACHSLWILTFKSCIQIMDRDSYGHPSTEFSSVCTIQNIYLKLTWFDIHVDIPRQHWTLHNTVTSSRVPQQ